MLQSRADEDPPMSTAELLKEFYLLRHAVGDDLTAPSVLRTLMEAIAEQRRYAPGEIIFRQGDAADAFYVVESGSVDILAADANPADGDTIVASLGTGDEFGEMAFFDGGTRSATARAGKSCNVLRVPYAGLRDELRKRPE